MKHINHYLSSFAAPLLIAYCLLLITTASFAQREVQYSQYLVNPLAINPAATGIRENFYFNAILRRQVIPGVQSLPITQSFAMDGTVGKGKVGLGLQGLNDRMTYNTAIFGSMSYIFNISDDQKISVGALGGINVLPSRDVLNAGGSINKAMASAGVGIYYQSTAFFGGVSMPEILKQQYGYNNTSGLLNYQRPVFVQLGLKTDVSDELRLTPSILITKPETGKVRIDLNTLMHYKERFMAGVSVRLGSTTYVQGLLSYDFSKNIRIGYTYNSRRVEDFNGQTTNLSGVGKGVHEIVFTLQPNPRSE
ncbi:MAG: PorP/SprF family type IX secretion system membrane protein [Spirosomataceae bacterium]